MAPPLGYEHKPYTGTIGSKATDYRYTPYKGTIKNQTVRYAPYKNPQQDKLYRGTIKQPEYSGRGGRPLRNGASDRMPNQRRVAKPPKEVKQPKQIKQPKELKQPKAVKPSKYPAAVPRNAPTRAVRPKNYDSRLYKGTIKWEPGQKPFKGYQYRPYKGTIGVTSGPYKEYKLRDDYYGFGKRRSRVYPLPPIPPKQYDPGYARQQPRLEQDMEYRENRYVPTYATAQTMNREIVDNTRYYQPEHAAVRKDDKQIIYNENQNKYVPAYASAVHREKEVTGPAPYQPETIQRTTEHRTEYEPSRTQPPAYAPMVAALHTNERTVDGPRQRKTPPRDPYTRHSPTVEDPLTEIPPQQQTRNDPYAYRPAPRPQQYNRAPPPTIVPVVAPVAHSSKKDSPKKNTSNVKDKKQIPPQEDNILETSAGQRMWSADPFVAAQPPIKSKEDNKAKQPQPIKPAEAPQKKGQKAPMVATTAAAAASNKRKPAEPHSRPPAPTLRDPISPFPPPSPEPLLPARSKNSPRRISPDPMRYEPQYKARPEPMFPPMIPVSSDDYTHISVPEAKALNQKGGNPLIPVMVPFHSGRNPYYNMSPPPIDDRYSYTPPSPSYPLSKYAGVPSYSAVGSVLRSMQVYGY